MVMLGGRHLDLTDEKTRAYRTIKNCLFVLNVMKTSRVSEYAVSESEREIVAYRYPIKSIVF